MPEPSKKTSNPGNSGELRKWFYKLRHPTRIKGLRSKIFTSDKGDFSLKPFDEHRCIFVHITKTAGTSVALSLFGYMPYHYTAIDYRVIYGRRDFNSYFKFAFVRNPWDRLYSAWRFLRAGGWDDDDRRWHDEHLAAFDDFEAFVDGWLDRDSIMSNRHFWPQHHFICDAAGKLLLDHLGYFETLQQDFEVVNTRLGLDAEMSSHNVNPGKDYREVYTQDMIQHVAEVYREDIDMFGYHFDGIHHRVNI